MKVPMHISYIENGNLFNNKKPKNDEKYIILPRVKRERKKRRNCIKGPHKEISPLNSYFLTGPPEKYPPKYPTLYTLTNASADT